MNWIKANPIPAAAALAVIAATAALAYLAAEAAQSTAEAEAALVNEARQLDALKKQKPYPNKENLQKIEADAAAYEKALAELKSTLADLDEPSSSTSPQAFQDALRKAVDGISSEALTKSVALPKDFYLGFNDFQTRLPSREEAISLDREFNVIKTLASQLVDLPVKSIDSLDRLEPLRAVDDSFPISKTRFTISFTAIQKNLVAAFNLVSHSNRFLVIRSVTFENSNPNPPAKVAADDDNQGQNPTVFPVAGANQNTQFDAVFGDETVTATLLIEIPTFPDPAKEPSPPASKP